MAKIDSTGQPRKMGEKETLSNRKRAAAWNKANKDRRKEIKKRSFAANRAKELRSRKGWHAKNKEKMAKANSVWKQANPDKVIEQAARRRALKRNAVTEKIASEQYAALLEKQNRVCAYCGTPLEAGKHLDHIVPLTRGGSHTIENLAYACPACNLSKGNKLLSEWIDRPANILTLA